MTAIAIFFLLITIACADKLFAVLWVALVAVGYMPVLMLRGVRNWYRVRNGLAPVC